LQQTNANLATLIGSRICHDLISPIGAINNGLELLGLTGGVQGPEMDLIADSVEHAEARIRFFRVAYGASGDQMMGQPEVVSILDDVGRGRRLTTQWKPTAAQSRADVRLAFLALQCCESALPYGGTVTFMVEDSVWTIVGTAEKLKFDADLWAGLSGAASQAEITPALVQFALLPVIATELKRKIKVVQSETQITLRF
jgi:histidine phosphotransferase ChpT